MTRAALVLPGRGSYTERSLGSLPPTHAWVATAEALRAEYSLEPLTGPRGLDAAERFEPARHLRPSNASALIYVASMLDASAARARHDVVCALGNSMGWYTALAAVGSLSFEDGFRLVQEMAMFQEEGGEGGQLIWPLVDETWRVDPARVATLRALLDATRGELFESIHLGGYAVLAGSEAGVKRALAELPKLAQGKATYPFRLVQHGPYHTPLAQGVSDRARRLLSKLEFRAPEVTLIDGRGVRHSPWSTDVEALREYTLGAQVTTPYDFGASVRVALREHAPERLVLAGPGNSLGGPCGQVLVAEGWRGVRAKDGFDALQASESPLLESQGLGR